MGDFTTTVAETKTLTAEAAGFSLQDDLTAVPGAPAQVTLEADPDGLTTDDTTTLTATLRDIQGNPSPGVDVAWTASGTGNAFSTATGTTDSGGRVATTLARRRRRRRDPSATGGSVRTRRWGV